MKAQENLRPRGLWSVGWVAMVLVGCAAAARGQSPDPFRPYNSQYDAYIYPMGPAGPGGGQGGSVNLPMRGQNQFQEYMNELQGAGRQRSERYGIGMPYYRTAVDPRYRPEARTYRPNQKTQRSFEDTRALISQKYIAAMAEKDPQKRRELMREYDSARQREVRAMSIRRASSPKIMDRAFSGGVSRGQAAGGTARPGAGSPADEPVREEAAPGRSHIPPAPPISSTVRRRSSAPARRTPSDVLERARAMDPGPDRSQPRRRQPLEP